MKSDSSIEPSLNGTQVFDLKSVYRRLTDSQKHTVDEILLKFDPTQITEKEAITIWRYLQDAGMQNRQDLQEIIEAAGFDLQAIHLLAAGENELIPLRIGENCYKSES